MALAETAQSAMQLLKGLEDVFAGAQIEVARVTLEHSLENIVKHTPARKSEVSVVEAMNLVMV